MNVATGIVLAAFAFGFETVGADCFWPTAGIYLTTVMMMCDLRARIIPTELCRLLVALGIVHAAISGTSTLVYALMCGIIASLAMLAIYHVGGVCHKGRQAVGFGDVRAAPALAVYLASTGDILAGLLIASVIGTILIGLALAFGKIEAKDAIPLAPFFNLWAIGSAIAGAL